MQVLTKILLAIGLLFTATAVLTPNVALATNATCADDAYVDETGAWQGGTNAKEACEGQANDLIGKVLRFVKILSALVVVFAVGMIIYGGFKYITSQGDPKQTESAKQQIWFAGVGLFIVLTAFTILQLFINASGGK